MGPEYTLRTYRRKANSETEINWGGTGWQDDIEAESNVSVVDGAVVPVSNAAIATEGLINWWPLIEDSGTVAADQAGQADGAVEGPTLGAVGIRGETCCLFEQAGDTVDIGSPLLDGSEAALSLSVWVKPAATGSLMYIHNHHEDSSSSKYDLAVESNGIVRFRLNRSSSGGGVNGSTALPSDRWSHIAVTWEESSGDVTIYLNGTVDGTGTINTALSSPGGVQNVRIGARTASGNQQFSGRISSIRVYEVPLTAETVGTIYSAGDPYAVSQATVDSTVATFSNPISRWSMDSGDLSGSMMVDQWGSNDMEVVGATTGLDGVGGGTATGYDGSSAYLNYDGPVFDGDRDLTISAWVRADSFAGQANDQNPIFVEEPASGNDTRNYLYCEARQPTFDQSPPSDGWLRADVELETDTWYHICATVSDSVRTLYINGVPAASDSAIETYSGGSIVETNIGRRNRVGQTWSGRIDEVRTWGEALTAEQVWKVYSIGERLVI